MLFGGDLPQGIIETPWSGLQATSDPEIEIVLDYFG